MERSINKCEFLGRLGADPEISVTTSGTTVAKLSIAVNQQYNQVKAGKTVKVEVTHWVRLTAWAKLAEIIAQYVHKGDKILVQTELRQNNYETKAGTTNYGYDFIINEMIMLTPANSASSKAKKITAEPVSEPSADEIAGAVENSDELPF